MGHLPYTKYPRPCLWLVRGDWIDIGGGCSEQPAFKADIGSFYISRSCISNEAFQAFRPDFVPSATSPSMWKRQLYAMATLLLSQMEKACWHGGRTPTSLSSGSTVEGATSWCNFRHRVALREAPRTNPISYFELDMWRPAPTRATSGVIVVVESTGR